MTTREQALEWLEIAFKRGYRDAYDLRDTIRKNELAKEIIGQSFTSDNAILLREVYRFGRGFGNEQRSSDEAIYERRWRK